MIGTNNKAILDLVRTYDPDRYLVALFAPSDLVPHLMALYAFNTELERIGGSVREEMLGEIRLEWWRESLEHVKAGEETGHPVADHFGKTAKAFALPAHEISGMIDARCFALSGSVMPDTEALQQYLGKTEGAVFRLAAIILGARDAQPFEAAQAAARAYGFAKILCALPHYLAAGCLPLPKADLLRYGVLDGALRERTQQPLDEAWDACLEAFIERISHAQAEAVGLVNPLHKSLRPGFLPLALTAPILRAMQRRGRDLDRSCQINPLLRYWRVSRAQMFGIF